MDTTFRSKVSFLIYFAWLIGSASPFRLLYTYKHYCHYPCFFSQKATLIIQLAPIFRIKKSVHAAALSHHNKTHFFMHWDEKFTKKGTVCVLKRMCTLSYVPLRKKLSQSKIGFDRELVLIVLYICDVERFNYYFIIRILLLIEILSGISGIESGSSFTAPKLDFLLLLNCSNGLENSTLTVPRQSNPCDNDKWAFNSTALMNYWENRTTWRLFA